MNSCERCWWLRSRCYCCVADRLRNAGCAAAASLNLPQPVTDLSAIRTGNQVSLLWTMPKKNTDKLVMKSDVTVRVCRQEVWAMRGCGNGDDGSGATGSYSETLPALLSTGPPRVLKYFVELKNRNGRSAGLSNAVETLAGGPPNLCWIHR